MTSKTGSEQIQKTIEKAEWEELFEFLDKDKNGEISYVEFVTRIDDMGEVTDFEDLQEAMKMFRDGDDGDKKLTKAEFAKMMGVKFTEIKVISAFLVIFSKNIQSSAKHWQFLVCPKFEKTANVWTAKSARLFSKF